MRIDHLHVKNFKGFEDRTFDFVRSGSAEPGTGSFHIIIGQNGTGKTSLLDALALGASAWLSDVSGHRGRKPTAEYMRLQINTFDDTERIERIYPLLVEIEGSVEGKAMHWQREFQTTGYDRAGAASIRQAGAQAVKRLEQGLEVLLPVIAYYGTGRLWPVPDSMRPETLPVAKSSNARAVLSAWEQTDLPLDFHSRLAGYDRALNPQCDPRRLLQWLRFEQQLALQENKESTQFTVVKEAIRQTVEDCETVEYHLRLGLLLKFKDRPRLPFGTLSDGQRNMVALIGDVAYRAAQLNPHLGHDVLTRTPGIVLIDEVDLHLHPLWQQHVVEDLRKIFPQMQFFVTTHSPFIVQTAREGELVKLDGEVEVEPASRSIEEIAQVLMDVDQIAQSLRFVEMRDVARRYLELTAQARHASDPEKEVIRRELVGLLAPYSDNPAYRALLERKGIAATT